MGDLSQRIIESLRIRPQTREELCDVFGAGTERTLNALLAEKKIFEYTFSGNIFYKTTDNAD
ncbi:MAG: hypothetical protein AABZ39_02190 [Spirochaetota bacterium]